MRFFIAALFGLISAIVGTWFAFFNPGMGEQAPLQRRRVHAKLFRGTALAAVQKPVLAGVVPRLQPGHGHALDDAVKIIHRLSPSLHE